MNIAGFESDISVHVEPVREPGRGQANRRDGQRRPQQAEAKRGSNSRRRPSRQGRRERAAAKG